jgi:hypothetical protein
MKQQTATLQFKQIQASRTGACVAVAMRSWFGTQLPRISNSLEHGNYDPGSRVLEEGIGV